MILYLCTSHYPLLCLYPCLLPGNNGSWGILQFPPPPSFLTPIQDVVGFFFHQGFGFHLPFERETRKEEHQIWIQQEYMGANGKTASDSPPKSFVPIKDLHRCHRTGLPLWAGMPRRLLATRTRKRSAGWEVPGAPSLSSVSLDVVETLLLTVLLGCWPPTLTHSTGDSLGFHLGSVGIPWGFCCHSSHIATPHFSVKEVGAAASLQPFLDISVGLWEIGQGWGMEGTGTCSGGGCVRSHPEMSLLPAMLEVGHKPESLSGGRNMLPAPEAPCPWQALRGVGELPFCAPPKGEPGYLSI